VEVPDRQGTTVDRIGIEPGHVNDVNARLALRGIAQEDPVAISRFGVVAGAERWLPPTVTTGAVVNTILVCSDTEGIADFKARTLRRCGVRLRAVVEDVFAERKASTPRRLVALDAKERELEPPGIGWAGE
jgi:hypothetical protein